MTISHSNHYVWSKSPATIGLVDGGQWNSFGTPHQTHRAPTFGEVLIYRNLARLSNGPLRRMLQFVPT